MFEFVPPLTALFQAPTIRQLAVAVRSRSAPSPALSLVEINRPGPNEPSAVPFICFPGGSGDDQQLFGHGISLAALSRLLGPSIPFYSLRGDQLDHGKSLVDVLPAVAERVLTSIRTVIPHGPYQLGGHSLGGLLAIEVARRLIAMGEDVALVALIDAFGPGYPRRRKPAERLRAHVRNLLRLNPRNQLKYLSTKFKYQIRNYQNGQSQNGDATSPVPDGYMEYLSQLTTYPGRLTLFRAEMQSQEVRFAHDDPTNGWGAVAESGVDVINIPGDHLSMLQPPNLQKLADELRSRLDTTGSDQGSHETPGNSNRTRR